MKQPTNQAYNTDVKSPPPHYTTIESPLLLQADLGTLHDESFKKEKCLCLPMNEYIEKNSKNLITTIRTIFFKRLIEDPDYKNFKSTNEQHQSYIAMEG